MTSPILAAALVAIAIALAGGAVVLLFVRDRSRLAAALRPYEVRDDLGDEDDGAQQVTLVESPFLQRAVDTTARIAAQRGVMDVVETKLDQAALPLRAAEALFVWLVAGAIITALGFVLAGAFGAFIAALVAALAPMAVLNLLAARRLRKFVSLLPDTLQLLASSMRAGYSLLQGLDTVAQESADPMGSELRRVLAEARLGRPVEEALEECGRRMRSADFDWAVMAIRIQREVGGNLAELLVTVSETMVARERLRRDVKGLTAEGRMSAIIIGLLPVGLGLMMYAVNPTYISVLFHVTVGKVMLGGGTLLALFGFWWMKKTIEVEV